MFKDIINTIGARYIVAFLNLMLIFINSKVLGREGMGVVGILYASANIAVIFNSILCGNTIVYFMNRYNMRYVFFPAYIWAFIGSLSVCGVMFALNILPEGYEITVFALATLISLFTANTLMVFGKDNVKGFNLAFIIQGLLMFLTLLFMYYVAGYNNITGYLTGLFAAYSTAFIYSFALLFRHLAKNRNRAVAASFFSVLKEMFVYGLWSGVDNLAEGLTTRINYFTVKQMSGGYGNVGLLDSGTKISESVWHISNSVSFIEYGSVSKTTDRQAQKTVTLRLFKLTYCALAVVMAVVVCLPEWLYTDYLMAPEFAGIRKIIIGLAAGVVALGSNRIL
ncbi:MAG: lipopolysaccharide biosynthesis protein, partial [Tannerella sp.]|nr:lipopolysaccharide biosynthesis protein [Tannerella sp.]